MRILTLLILLSLSCSAEHIEVPKQKIHFEWEFSKKTPTVESLSELIISMDPRFSKVEFEQKTSENFDSKFCNIPLACNTE